jgi:DNA repair protein RadC
LRMETVAIGTVDAIMVRPADVLKTAVRLNAPHVLLVHCHPSGAHEPSPLDVAFTRGVVQACTILGLELVDHLIIGHGHWTSLKERRLGW